MNMEMIKEEGFSLIEGGVCAAKGFVAGGLHCGLYQDKAKNDLCLLYSEAECSAAAVYTQNKVKGAPILVTQKHLAASGGKARAIIANSKNANTCNADGEKKAERMCELAAEQLGISAKEVIVASTGVIGQTLPIEPIEQHIGALAAKLSSNGHTDAACAIMTTDTVRKEVAVSFYIDGTECHIGGMAKGSGMIHPTVLKTAGIDPEVYHGFAWGGGIDRLAMLKYNTGDVRYFESGKLDFLEEF